jgi:iron complex outermembrane receptor protein
MSISAEPRPTAGTRHQSANLKSPSINRSRKSCRKRRSPIYQIFWLLIAAAAPPTAAGAATQPSDLFELSIEELGELRVTSVSRRDEPLRDAPSSIYVITSEEIRRSGLNSLPEILRLAPGVEVARNGSHSWTISIRGFNSDLSNKLLVLIDGRSVYSPLFAGVFWDAQDTMVQDIERIEVISGPGGTLWGANAVNGVINVITRSSLDTQGALVDAGAGNELAGFAGLRYGWQMTDDIAARAYVKYLDQDASQMPSGQDGVDDWHFLQGGFRTDWEQSESDRITVQGDVYDASLSDLLRGDFTLGTLPGPDTPGTVDVGGFNLLARWNRDLESGGQMQLQSYFDHTSRDIPGSFNESRDTLDLYFQHDMDAGERHRVTWGAGFRVTSDELDNTLFASFIPDERTDKTVSLFVQDDIGFRGDSVVLTLGAKVEHNDYTDYEFQPNVRLLWRIDDRQSLWSAVSRAVRIPARLNTDLHLVAPFALPGTDIPLYFNAVGNPDFDSEDLVATELGYRVQVHERLSLDLALYRHDYDHLQTQEAGDLILVGTPLEYLVIPATLANNMEGKSYGGTVVATWQALPDWRLQFQYAYLDLDLQLKGGSNDTGALGVAGNSPRHQAAVHSYLELPRDIDFYTRISFVDELPNQAIPDRTSIDASVGWRPVETLRLALTVQSLNDKEHVEFGGGSVIERSAWLNATWTF